MGIFSFLGSLLPIRWRKEVTQEEIETLIDSGQETGLIDEEGNEMIHRIFDLKDIVVREVMVPRTDIKALDIEAPVEEVANLVVKAGHSRMPVYEETIDKIVGIVYAKDLLKYWVTKGQDLSIADIMRKPLFVPETKSIPDMLKELKDKRIHIAIVVDEYGGTSGVVTIEDLIEEIVGDIQDEYDVEEEEFVVAENGEYIVDARIDIDEFSEKLNIEIPREEYDTLGGFLAHLSDKIPSVNEEIHYKDLVFTVTDGDERRVSKVRIKVNPELGTEEKKTVGETSPQSADE